MTLRVSRRVRRALALSLTALLLGVTVAGPPPCAQAAEGTGAPLALHAPDGPADGPVHGAMARSHGGAHRFSPGVVADPPSGSPAEGARLEVHEHGVGDRGNDFESDARPCSMTGHCTSGAVGPTAAIEQIPLPAATTVAVATAWPVHSTVRQHTTPPPKA